MAEAALGPIARQNTVKRKEWRSMAYFMKIKNKVRLKYSWFLQLGEKQPRPLPSNRVPMDAHGLTAEQCFHQLESTGKCWYCREPELLEAYMAGKEIHGMTIDMVAKDFAIDRLTFSKEIRANYPEWVASEIFASAKKLAMKELGYMPGFVAKSKDHSEWADSDVDRLFAEAVHTECIHMERPLIAGLVRCLSK